MSAEAWRVLSLPAREDEIPALESALEGLGALAITLEALEDQALFDLLDGSESPLWSRCQVEALFPAAVDIEAMIAELAAAGFPALGARHRLLADQDWQAAFRAHFQPLQFGELWVVPGWHEPPPGARQVLRLDPGMAFGTGTHPTTALCLSWLAEQQCSAHTRVLDYGCGSGILALGAVRLGAGQVTAVDIDPAACEVARENAARNACETLHIGLPGTLSPPDTAAGQFDLILANLLLQPILLLRDEFARRLPEGGRIALSGILVEQVPRVVAAYQTLFTFESPRVQGDWALLDGQRLA